MSDLRKPWLLRRMQQSDIGTLARLRHAAFFEGTERTVDEDAAALRSLLSESGRQTAIVATVADRPVGTCLLVPREIDALHDVTPWLAGLVVEPEFRSQGIGTALVRAIETEARNDGIGEIYLYTDGAEEFYARLGWTEADRVDDRGAMTVLMRRLLTS